MRLGAIIVLPSAGLVMLEVSVVVFLLQGYLTSGREVKPSLAVSPYAPVISWLCKAPLRMRRTYFRLQRTKA